MCIQCLHMHGVDTLCIRSCDKICFNFNLYRRIADIVLIMMNDDNDDMNYNCERDSHNCRSLS